MPYANGRIPASALGTIPGTMQRVLAVLVPQVAAMRAAFEAHFGKPLVITDGYRSYDAQVRVKALKGKFAATPGTSEHGWGTTLDIGSNVNRDGTPEYAWMVANAPRFGFHNPQWARDWDPRNGQHEPWHWESSATPVPTSDYAGTQSAATPEDDMPLNEADHAAIRGDIISILREQEVANIIAASSGPAAFDAGLRLWREKEIALIIAASSGSGAFDAGLRLWREQEIANVIVANSEVGAGRAIDGHPVDTKGIVAAISAALVPVINQAAPSVSAPNTAAIADAVAARITGLTIVAS